MDLIERINSLTDDQLRMVAERDDASGVLASYRLAELRGLPHPDRQTVILGDGYAIVAMDGKVSRVDVDSVEPTEKIIRQEEGQFCVYSEDGSRSFGCYDTMDEARARLAQIHYFSDEKQTIRQGTFVSWAVGAGTGRGQVQRIQTEGRLNVPDSSYYLNADPENPAVLIRVWRETADGWEATDRLVGHKRDSLTRIEPLNKNRKIVDGLRYPAAAFAHIPDITVVSGWEILMWEDPRTGPTEESMRRALAEFQALDLDDEERHNAARALAGSWSRAMGDAPLPEILVENGVTKETFTPPKGVQAAAQRALGWIAEGHAGGGFTDVGRARAAQLARGDNVSEQTIRRMRSFFARHSVNRGKQGWTQGDDGFPSPARVAWDAWGGDPGKSWADTISARLDREDNKQACPAPTSNILMNLMNRQEAIDVANYGPLNPEEPNEDYWQEIADQWEVTTEDAKESLCGNCAAFDITSKMKDCIAQGMEGDTEDPYDVIDAGELGYCRAFKFKCAAARTCSAWIAGGPITDDDEVQGLAKASFLQKQAEQRFTLGPLYVPDFMDAHGEWTDANELQTAVWGWVRSGDRRIFLQHDRDVEAGEWVEVMTMPQSWTVKMMDAEGEQVGEVTYPPNTVFLGVIWNEDAWEMVKAGQLRGYSIGGYSDRVFAELPEDAQRDGVDLPREPVDLAKSIAAAVADAMRQAQPVVNVVMPETKATKVRRIERDEQGNIARIIEEDD